MESPQAAWVDMLMTRLHGLESKVDSLEEQNLKLRLELEQRAPLFAPTFNCRTDYFFYASVDWRLSIAEWKSKFAVAFEEFTIARVVVGHCSRPDNRHPVVNIVGLLRNTGRHSCAAVSRSLLDCMGDSHTRLDHERPSYANVSETTVGDVCAAVISRCDQSAHRDPDCDPECECSSDDSDCDRDCLCSTFPDLDFILDPDMAYEFHGQLKSFMASDHILEHLTDDGALTAIEEIQDTLCV